MEYQKRKSHWEKIYQTKKPGEFSWFQESPRVSLDFLNRFHLPKTARIIDIGGGDSLLVDHLLDQGYQDITVLDISETALQRARERLGARAAQVRWIVADVADFRPDQGYDCWHDRATFHFLTEDPEINRYIQAARSALRPGGYLVLGTFSEQGPEKCSGITIKRYSESGMSERLRQFFRKIRCIRVEHLTPINVVQSFIFCSFRKLKAA